MYPHLTRRCSKDVSGLAFGSEATLSVLVMSEALKEGFRLVKCVIAIFTKEKEMAHFASGLG